MRFGVQKPAIPASDNAGLMALVGHTFMHNPHLWHKARKSFSLTEPGGRMRRGLGILWSAPKSESWLALVGFAGHAFVTTALLAASFVYYRDMGDWVQNVYEHFQQINRKPSSMA